MPAELNVETDCLPSRVNEHSRDWSDLLATRQLAEPLFIEEPNRSLSSRILASCERLDEQVWRLWIDAGATVSADDVVEQVARARGAAAAGLMPALMLSELETEGRLGILVKTRFPVAALGPILASPALAPHSRTATDSGVHELAAEGGRLVLRTLPDGRVHRLVAHYPTSAPDRFENHDVDASGPMCVGPNRWGTHAGGPGVFPLDFCFVLLAPPRISLVALDIDPSEVVASTNGMVRPVEAASSLWSSGTSASRPPRPASHVESAVPPVVEFANFAGNREMALLAARALERATGRAHRIVERPYADFLARPRVEGGYRLGIMSSPWPHPAAMLCQLLFMAGVGEDVRRAILAALAEPDLNRSVALAARAEALADLPARGIRVMGQPYGLMRSRQGSVWCPPSGWLDHATLC